MSQMCARCGALVADDARFCAACGAPLDTLQGAERKLGTMVFADLVGSTELATDLDPEELRQRLAPFFEVARATLEEHGGRVEKYVGDAVMAVFGVPRSYGDDPDRAVAAALALRDRVGALGDGLTLRVGVETGEVLALERAGDLSVTGEAVNAAARLQQAAAPGEVLVGERTAGACRAAELEDRGPIDAKGFPAPLLVWRAVAASAQRPQETTRFVGRQDDLDLLRLIYRRAVRERVPELVTVTGEAGIGKTRLAGELVAELRAGPDPPTVLLGRNPPYGRGIAFWALGEILRAAAGASADDSVGDVHAALARRLEELGADDADELAAALGMALGGDPIDGDVEDALKHAWRRLVALLAGERPVVIGIDDAHWADDGLLDLIEEVAFSVDGAPVLLLCTTRPELLERRPGFGRAARNVTQIELRPLGREPSTELAMALLPDASSELAPRVAEASSGNPFFAEEMACRIVEDPDAALGERLPETVQAAIAARLDLLPVEEKRAIQYAAVLGPGFLEEALADLLGEPQAEELAALVRKSLLQERLAEGPGRFAFRHQLIRDVAYASLPRAERASLHERAAEGIRRRAGERYPELAELVTFHLLRANELGPTDARGQTAREASLEAAEIAARRGATARAQELYEQSAALAGSDRERAEALDAAAGVALQRWRGDESLRLLREMADIAERGGEARLAAGAYARAVEVVSRMGGITGDLPEEELQAMLDRGRALVPDDDKVTRARLLLDEAWMSWRLSCNEEMAGPARAGLELARQTEDIPVLSSALDAVAALAWTEGRYGLAVEHARERLELLAGVRERAHAIEVERSDALHMMIESLVATGDFRQASEYADQARELDLSRGGVFSGWARNMLPSFFLGEWDRTLEMARGFRDAWSAADHPPVYAMAAACGSGGAILGYRGDEAGAADWFAFSESIAPSTGGQLGGLHMMRADVDLHHGRVDEAAARLAAPAATTTWWRSPYAATRAEAMVRAGGDDAPGALTEAEALVGDHSYARGVLMRAQGLYQEDENRLRDAFSLFEQIECPYQAARTGWLLGGDDGAEAERTLARLGAPPPVG